MSPYVVAGLTTLPDFRTKGVRIALQTGFNRALPLLLVSKIVRAVVAIAHVTEFAVREAIAVTVQRGDKV